MSHDWLIKNAERANQGKRFSAHARIKITPVDIDASGPWLDFDQ